MPSPANNKEADLSETGIGVQVDLLGIKKMLMTRPKC